MTVNISPGVTSEESQVLVNASGMCVATEDYPQCSAPVIPMDQKKRIRREVRSLTTEQWDKVVAAMWVMKTTDMNTGKDKYGDAFRTYDSLVLKHALATTDTRGDQVHFGAHFITWHLAFVLEFENSLLAVDPTIEEAPYWDECITEPSAFTNDYFGTDPTEAPYEVVDGKFAYWPIERNFSIDDWSSFIVENATVAFNGQASSSFLRGPENSVTTPFATRYGSGTGWESSVSATCTDEWWGCTSEFHEAWNDWYACIESSNPSFHSGPHVAIGGRAQGQGGGGPPMRQLQGGAMERGDFEDPVTSPNGPIFMFHHANLDRSRLWWTNRHNDEAEICSYYGFPVDNAAYIFQTTEAGGANFEGAHLNDVVSSAWGFTPQDLGLTSMDSNATRTAPSQLTHADILCWLNPETAPYTYDTHVDCWNDPSLCHAVQDLEEEEEEEAVMMNAESSAPAVLSKDAEDTSTSSSSSSMETDREASSLFQASTGTKVIPRLLGLCVACWLPTLLMSF